MQVPDASRMTPMSSPAAAPSPATSTQQAPAAPTDQVTLQGKKSEAFVPSPEQMRQWLAGSYDGTPSPVSWEGPACTDASPRGMAPCPDGSVLDVIGSDITKRDASGATLWSTRLPSPLLEKSASLVVGRDGTVIVGSEDNRLRGFEAATGREAWSLDLGAKFKVPATVAQDGDLVVFRKTGEQLELCRVGTDGTIRQQVALGTWDEPIGDGGSDVHLVDSDAAGRLLAHGSVKIQRPGEDRPFMHNMTWSLNPDGSVESTASTLDPPEGFPSDPDHYYHVDYSKMQAFDRHSGQPLWTLEKKHVGYDPKIGPYGDTLFELGGEHKYKYIKFFDARPGRVYLQAYIETSKGTFHTGEELMCLDPADPSKVLWKRETKGSVFRGPLHVSPDLILHVSDEKTGTIEAVDPSTGNPRWSISLLDPKAGERVVGPGPEPGFVRVARESPDNYAVERSEDGTIYLRTYKRLFAIDPATGSIRSAVRSEHQLGGFAVGSGGRVTALDVEAGAVKGFVLETPTEALEREASRLEEQAREAPVPPSIQMGDEEVFIAGVKVPKRR